jgi:hypothetical protein
MSVAEAERFVGAFDFASRQEYEDTRARIANPDEPDRLCSRRAQVVAETIIELSDFDSDLQVTERWPLNAIDPISLQPTIPQAKYYPELVFSTHLSQEDVLDTYTVLNERMPR